MKVPNNADCISFHANTLEKVTNPAFLSPDMGNQEGTLSHLAMVRQLVYENENSEFKPAVLR